MSQHTLWGALEHDRRRWIRAGALVFLLVVLLAVALWLVFVVRAPRAGDLVIRVLVPLFAILTFPLVKTARELRVGQSIGAIPVATGMLLDTKSALHDVTLAAGIAKPPVLLMYFDESLNAFINRSRGALNISVSSAFAELPRAEQRAGIAMLVGRSQVDCTSFAAEHQLAESLREDPVPPDRDPVLFSAWLDAAVAGDREGLRILGEPVPMIELLERLSITSTVVPGFAYTGGHDAVFDFLAWPYLDTAKALADQVTAHGAGLPPRAAAAVAALIAEEQSMSRTSGLPGSMRSASISGAEGLRALRLREVTGAEGAIAGSTTAAARRREDPVATTTPAAPMGSPAAGATEMTTSATSAELLGGAITLGVTTTVTRVPLEPDSPPPTPTAPRRDVERITVRCPSCHAGNAPGNRTCVACGERMPRPD